MKVYPSVQTDPGPNNVLLVLSRREAEVLRYIAGRDIIIPTALRKMLIRRDEQLICEVEDLLTDLQTALDDGGIKIA